MQFEFLFLSNDLFAFPPRGAKVVAFEGRALHKKHVYEAPVKTAFRQDKLLKRKCLWKRVFFHGTVGVSLLH